MDENRDALEEDRWERELESDARRRVRWIRVRMGLGLKPDAFDLVVLGIAGMGLRRWREMMEGKRESPSTQRRSNGS